MSPKIFKPSSSSQARIKTLNQRTTIYAKSIEDPDNFRAEIAERISRYKKWDIVVESDFKTGHLSFFQGGKCQL